MSDYLVTGTELTETADAIRAKTGDSNLIEWESGTGFADAVAAIPSGGGGGNAHYQSLTVTNTVDRNWIRFTHNLGVAPQIIRVRSVRSMNGEITTVPDDLALGETVYEFVSVETLFNLSGQEQTHRGVTAARNAANQKFGVGTPTLNLKSSMPGDYVGTWEALYVTATDVFLSSGYSNFLYLAGITYFVEVWG